MPNIGQREDHTCVSKQWKKGKIPNIKQNEATTIPNIEQQENQTYIQQYLGKQVNQIYMLQNIGQQEN